MRNILLSFVYSFAAALIFIFTVRILCYSANVTISPNGNNAMAVSSIIIWVMGWFFLAVPVPGSAGPMIESLLEKKSQQP